MNPFYNDRHFYHQPVRQSDPIRQTDRNAPPKRAPKVFQIPIHFVGSDEQDRSGSALKIQKVLRGFFVRKCVKKIIKIDSRVDEIEATLASDGGLETVRGDEKERLRTIEGLMSLLFKLDSIKGFDLGVRAYRKAVTRRVIALQERIDSIVTVDSSCNRENADAVGDEIVRVYTDDVELGRNSANSENSPAIDSCIDDDESRVSTNCPTAEVCLQGNDNEEKKHEDDGTSGGVEADQVAEGSDDSDILDQHRNSEENDNSKNNRELLERIMEDNEKMMKMLTQLCEKNESQSKIITALANRVELLEKVFVCEKLRKIKKKKSTSCATC